jgi:hypothetical protein
LELVSIRYPDDFYLPDAVEAKYYRDIALQVKKIAEDRLKF